MDGLILGSKQSRVEKQIPTLAFPAYRLIICNVIASGVSYILGACSGGSREAAMASDFTVASDLGGNRDLNCHTMPTGTAPTLTPWWS